MSTHMFHPEPGHSDMYCTVGLCVKLLYPKYALGQVDWHAKTKDWDWDGIFQFL